MDIYSGNLEEKYIPYLNIRQQKYLLEQVNSFKYTNERIPKINWKRSLLNVPGVVEAFAARSLQASIYQRRC